MSFKEDFITGCYYYMHYDRSEYLRTHPPKLTDKGGTISPLEKKKKTDVAATIVPDTMHVFDKPPACSLRPLKDTDEIDDARPPLEFSGDSLSLNRGNLDPDNYTITSKVQAEIKFVNGQWYIENKSRLKTTFIQVLTPVKLKKG